MTLIPKEHIVPGAQCIVVHAAKRGLSDSFVLNPHTMLMAGSRSYEVPEGAMVEVLSKPRKRDGINLVEVSVEGTTGEVYYTDLVNRCKLVERPGW